MGGSGDQQLPSALSLDFPEKPDERRRMTAPGATRQMKSVGATGQPQADTSRIGRGDDKNQPPAAGKRGKAKG